MNLTAKISLFLIMQAFLQACGGGSVSHPFESIPSPPVVVIEYNNLNQLIINWDDQVGVNNYTLYLSTSKNFINSETTSFTVEKPSHLITAEKVPQKYYVKIQANTLNRVSTVSNPKSFTSQPLKPENLYVNITADNNTIELTWNSVNDAYKYTLYRSKNDKLDVTTANLIENISSPFLIDSVLSDQGYNYWIVAISKGEISAYSNISKNIYLPTANAGADKIAQVSSIVTLDGTARHTDDVTYLWNSPDNITLDNISTASPTFTIPVESSAGEVFIFQLTVTDTLGVSSKPDDVKITVNTPPIADAGKKETVIVGDIITLDASESLDIDNQKLSYEWQALEGFSFSSTTALKPQVTVAEEIKAGDYFIRLRVTDSKMESGDDDLIITVLNTAPTSDPGENKTMALNTTVVFDGSGSFDVNGDDLDFSWNISSSPNGSITTLNNARNITSSFIPDVLGNYQIELVVDDKIDSSNASLLLSVIEINLDMAVIPEGSFLMGVPVGTGTTEEQGAHIVDITRFEMGKYELTFSEYDKFLIDKGVDPESIVGTPVSPGSQIDGGNPEAYDSGWGREKRPVIGVSWVDVQDYLEWLNSIFGIDSNDPKKYRLPTEAEWEYAARAQTEVDSIKMKYPWGDSINHDDANYGNNRCCSGRSVGNTADIYLNTAPVGLFPPNQFGLFDMQGNIWEWVADCWHSNYTDAPSNGEAWLNQNKADCSLRVLRGGSWFNSPRFLELSFRGKDGKNNRFSNNGFRLARSL